MSLANTSQLLSNLKQLSLTSALALVLITQGFNASTFVAHAADEASVKIDKVAKKKASHFVLDNGLEVVVIPDHRAPVVTHMVWYKVGSADEVAGKSGIAHYLEHLMFKGTSTYKNNEFSKSIAEIGGRENAFTSTDYTSYFQRVSPDVLEDMMAFEADRMENLTLTDETVLPERDVIIEERRSRIDTRPGALLNETMNATLYKNHRYGVPIIGWLHEMKGLTKDDAIAYYDKYYTPNNAILVVAGDVEPDEVKAMAERTYGKVKRRAEPGARQRVKEPTPHSHRTVTVSDPKVTTPSWQRMYLVPSYNTAEGRDAEALEVLSQILGEGPTSRLYSKLILDKKMAANVGAYYRYQAIDDSSFGFYGSPQNGIEVEALEEAVDEVIQNLIKNGVTKEEVKRAQNRTIISSVYEQDSQESLARTYGSFLATGASIDEIEHLNDRMKEVTVEDVNRVAKKYLKKTAAVSGYLLPEVPAVETPAVEIQTDDTKK